MPITNKTLKQYTILEEIGKGGMGEVYLAKDSALGRKVAIKVLTENMEQDPSARERFVREARSAAALDHPFICKVYETGEHEGQAFLVMEYLEGKTLKERIEDEEVLTLRESIQITLEIAEALEKAHNSGIIHRDLKPANIILTPQGHVKVMDFGLAKWVETEEEPDLEQALQTMTQHATLTEEGAIAGTLAYMSPEQARGKKLDRRSDIFSLGLMFYEMTTGRHPFMKTSGIETLSAILRDPTPPPQVRPKSVNPQVAPLFRKALAKDKDKRYQDVKEFIVDLKKVLRDTTGGTKLLPKRWPLMAAAGVLIITVLVVAILQFMPKRAGGPAETELPPVSVLIADFQNNTGDSVFDGAIEQLLGISLETAPFISVYERGQARKLVNQLNPAAEGKLTAEQAQLVSTREGIGVVIDAKIEPDGDGYRIELKAIDPVKNEPIAELSRRIKNKAEIGKAVDALSSELREELGGNPTEASQTLAGETFTVSSLAAINAYAKAQELNYQGQREEAIKWFLKALDHDPNLGRAYASLGVIYGNLQMPEESEKYFEMAMARIDQMSERERLRTLATYHLIKKNYPSAINEFTTLIEKYPADISAYTNLAFAHFQSRNMAMAAEVGRRAVDFNPNKSIYRYNQIWYAMGAGKFEEAEQEIHALLKLEPDYTEAYVCKALLELAQGQARVATETYELLADRSPYGAALASTGLADIAAYEGRLSDAVEILETGIPSDLENKQVLIAADKNIALAQHYMLLGKKDLAAAAADSAVATLKIAEIMFPAAEIYIQAGQENKARDLAAEMSRKIQPAHRAFAKLIGGELSKARGDAAGAIPLYLEAQELVDMWYGRYLLGCAYIETEAYSEAYSELEQCLKRVGEATSVFFIDLPTYRYLPPVYYYLGLAQEGLSSDAAQASFETFLIIKEKADGDWMVEDARQRIN